MAKKTAPKKITPDPKLADLSQHHMVNAGGTLTTDTGVPLSHTDDSLKAGVRGPTIMDDFHLREKIMRFDHERIPERVVHARGAGAHGFFECTMPMRQYTTASFLAEAGKRTPVFVRFSTVAGSRGSTDTARDVRGFATKFYTDEGNFDLVGNNMPVFFIQDGIKFPDLIHSVKPEPHHEIPQASSAHDTFYDFISLTPESMHMIMWLFSDRAIPRSYATMEGFGVHTFRLVNAQGKSHFVKFHWKPKAGMHSLVWDEAVKLSGFDCDFHRRSLFEDIEAGQFPEWELGVQIIPEKDEMKFEFDLLDPTKIVPEELVPVQIIGRMVLNRNPENYFAETEQVAYCVSNLVPGIDVTNDPLMQARLFSYLDTQLTRLGGPNFNEIPINRPVAPVTNNQQDGFMRQGILKSRVNYSPNSLADNSPAVDPKRGYKHFPQMVEGMKTRERSPSFSDHYSQAALFFHSLSEVEQKHLIDAGSFELSRVEHQHIRERMVEHLAQIDMKMAQTIASRIGVKAPKAKAAKVKPPKPSPALSQMSNPGVTIGGRNVAVLVTPGCTISEVEVLKAALAKKGAKATLVAPNIGDTPLKAEKTFFNCSSVNFDAVFVPGGAKHIEALRKNADALKFLNEAFRHHKFIGLGAKAESLLEETDIVKDAGVVSGPEALVKMLPNHRQWKRETLHVKA